MMCHAMPVSRSIQGTFSKKQMNGHDAMSENQQRKADHKTFVRGQLMDIAKLCVFVQLELSQREHPKRTVLISSISRMSLLFHDLPFQSHPNNDQWKVLIHGDGHVWVTWTL